jgi:hypothetical protein
MFMVLLDGFETFIPAPGALECLGIGFQGQIPCYVLTRLTACEPMAGTIFR